MVEFRYLHGAVYIFENTKAQRVKVGMTISNVDDRLKDVNDKWLERKATCQICGTRRMVNISGLVPIHPFSGPQYVVNDRFCPGGNALPLEKDLALAESYLENMKNHRSELSGVEKKSATRIINTLEKRIEKFRNRDRSVGTWQFRVAFYTESAEQIELLSHKILEEHLDKRAPFGEVFCCSVSDATEAIETVLSQQELLHSARKETQPRAAPTLYREYTECQDPERKPAKYECVICRSQWEGVEPGTNSCPKCGTHLYSRFLEYV